MISTIVPNTEETIKDSVETRRGFTILPHVTLVSPDRAERLAFRWITSDVLNIMLGKGWSKE